MFFNIISYSFTAQWLGMARTVLQLHSKFQYQLQWVTFWIPKCLPMCLLFHVSLTGFRCISFRYQNSVYFSPLWLTYYVSINFLLGYKPFSKQNKTKKQLPEKNDKRTHTKKNPHTNIYKSKHMTITPITIVT